MHCFSASSVSCVTEHLSGCKDTDLYWIRANYYLKKYYSTVAFWITSFDTVTKCLLPPFKSVEQSKLRHACLSKKKTFVEQTNNSPNDYEKVASDSIVKVPCKLYMNQRLFGTTIVTDKMNGYDNKPVLIK